LYSHDDLFNSISEKWKHT